MRWLAIFILLMLAPAPFAQAQGLRIYCEDDPPNQMLGADGNLTGMCVEVAREIQKRIGNQDPIELVPWARGYDAVLHVPNTVLFSMSRTADRNDLFQWVGPILESTYGFYAKANSPCVIKSLKDAKKLKSIGVYKDDVRDTFLTKAGFTNLERTTNNIQNFKKLMADRIEVYASASMQIEEEARAAGYLVSDVKEVFPFLRVQLYFAMSKGTPDSVVKTWSEAFASMQKDGTFATIHKKYYPSFPLPGKPITKF